MSSSWSRLRRLVPTLLLLGGTILVSLVLVEVVLRVYAGGAETSLAIALRSDPYGVLVEPHGTAGYRPRPERAFPYDNGTVANVNASGFRGPGVVLPKPPGTFRVLLLGGSTTFGWGVGDDETIDAFMRRALAERYPSRAIDVVNLGFDGYDSYQLLERLRSEGSRFQPDAVIVNTGVNDVRNAPFSGLRDADPRTLLYRATMEQLRVEQARGGPTLWTRMKHHFYLARLPGWVRGGMRGSVDAGPAAAPEVKWEAVDYFERNVRRLIELAGDLGSKVVLLSTPPSSLSTRYEPDAAPERSYWIRDAATTQMYRDSLAARLRAIADSSPAEQRPFVEYVPHAELAPELFLDDAHLMPEGNRRVAADFVDALEPWLADDCGVGQSCAPGTTER